MLLSRSLAPFRSQPVWNALRAGGSGQWIAQRGFASGPYIFKVPMMGDSITEGTITSWQKKEGETVNEDETFITIETDKVSWR